MDMMEARLRMMAMQESVNDTTIKILEYDKIWRQGNLANSNDSAASIIYTFEPKSVARKLVYEYLYVQLNLFTDGTYVDYWNVRIGDTRNVINANCNGLAVSIESINEANAYAYLPDTGEILFAGKNSIYYGHKNISELN